MWHQQSNRKYNACVREIIDATILSPFIIHLLLNNSIVLIYSICQIFCGLFKNTCPSDMSYKQDMGVCEDVYNSLPVGTPGVASAATATQSCLECKFY